MADKQDKQTPIRTDLEAAQYAGVSSRTIRTKKKDFPLKDHNGNFSREALDRYVRPAAPDKSSLKEKTLFADLELKGKKSELAQWELDLRAGKYVLAAEVDQQSIAKIIECRRAMLAMPRKLSAKLEQKTRTEVQDVLQVEVAYWLDVFAGQKVTPPADPVIEVMEYYQLLDKKDRLRFKELLGKRHIKTTKHTKHTKEVITTEGTEKNINAKDARDATDARD